MSKWDHFDRVYSSHITACNQYTEHQYKQSVQLINTKKTTPGHRTENL